MPTEQTKPHIAFKREGSSWNGWCVNYSGMMDEKLRKKTHCKAGVEYEAVKKELEFTYSYEGDKTVYSSHQAYPCFKKEHALTDGCSRCRFPSEEEIKKHHDMLTKHIVKTLGVRAAIEDKLKSEKRKHGVGEIPCPACKTGTVSFSKSSYNDHIHAHCSTKDCIFWME